MSVYDATFDLSSDTLLPGVTVLGFISTLSTVSVFGLLVYLFVGAFVYGKDGNKDDRLILRTHFGVFVVFLFLSDLTQSMSGVIQLVWASQKQITPGTLCTAQAIMLQMGDLGTAVWNAVIAIHTFWAVVLGRKMTRRGAVSLAVLGWAIVLLITTVGPLAIQNQQDGPFYGVASAWCFITTPYAYPRILLHYLPMLLSAAIITVLYVLVALVLFRVLIVHGGTWRFEAPTRKSGSVIRDFFGQFSWSRLYRSSESVSTQSAVMAQRSERALSGMPDDTGGWKNSLQITPKREVKRDAATVSQSEEPGIEDPHSEMSVRLKKLAIKMLWYPSVYIVLILPITVTRIDLTMSTSISVMLGFTCIFLFMGTADTLIFIFTRRLGPAPWVTRVPPPQDEAERGDMQPVPKQGIVSMKIRVDRWTRRGTDDQSINLARKKSSASILTDITNASSIPPTTHIDLDPLGSKAGSELTGAPIRRSFFSASSSLHPHRNGGHQPHSPEYQNQTPYQWALPEPPVQQREQERPHGLAFPHPYSRP